MVVTIFLSIYFLSSSLTVFCKNFFVPKDYSTISSALQSAAKGDSIYVSYGNYNEKFVLAYDDFSLIGVPDSNGNLPIIDGNGAIQSSWSDYTNGERGLIKVGTSNTPSSTCPKNILIQNFHLKNALYPNAFTGRGGAADVYEANAAGVYIECGKNISIISNEIENNGNGIFVGIFGGETQDILIRKNKIWDSGNTGSAYEHNLYCSAVRITYEFNTFLKLRTGCDGNNLKDRSIGTIIRYNWIEDGNRQLDLVDMSDTCSNCDNLRAQSDYHSTYVYGNVLKESDDGNRQMIHYGGDGGTQSYYRKGTLYLDYNTIISTRTDRSTLLRLSDSSETCIASNNIIFNKNSAAYFEMISSKTGTFKSYNNFIRKGFIDAVDSSGSGSCTYSNTFSSTSDNPGFVSIDTDYHLLNDSFIFQNCTSNPSSSFSLPQFTPDSKARLNWYEIGAYFYSSDIDPNNYKNTNFDEIVAAVVISVVSSFFLLVILFCVVIFVILLSLLSFSKQQEKTKK